MRQMSSTDATELRRKCDRFPAPERHKCGISTSITQQTSKKKRGKGAQTARQAPDETAAPKYRVVRSFRTADLAACTKILRCAVFSGAAVAHNGTIWCSGVVGAPAPKHNGTIWCSDAIGAPTPMHNGTFWCRSYCPNARNSKRAIASPRRTALGGKPPELVASAVRGPDAHVRAGFRSRTRRIEHDRRIRR